MPAKKGAKTSPAIIAKEAELAHEAELLRQETQKERLRNEECQLRQHIEEEERKILEAHRVREREVCNTVVEAERKAFYEAKERGMAAEMAQKTQEVQEAQAALALKQQECDLLEKEKASALRRVALLSNELELAQLRSAETQQRASAADKEQQDAQRQWEAQYDALKQSYQELEMKCASAELERSKLASEAAERASEEAAKEQKTAKSRPSSDEETAMLLRVMQGEMERYKALATDLQEEVEHIRKEEEKSNLLVGILNTQLESVREDNKRLHELSVKRQAELDAAGELRREAQEARHAALTEMERVLSAAAVQQRQLELELAVHRGEAEKLSVELANAKQEGSSLREELKETAQKAAQQAQADQAVNMEMQAELNNQKKDLALALKAKETAEDTSFNNKILNRAEIDSLKTRLQRLQETMERKDREAVETIAVLKADVFKLQSSGDQAAKEHDATTSMLQGQLSKAEAECESLRTAIESLRETSQRQERDLYEQLTRVTAHHSTTSEELDRLRADVTRKDSEYTHNTICLNAERENLKMKIAEVTEAAEKQCRAHAQRIEQLCAETKQLEDRLSHESHAYQSACTKECERADMAERNVRRLQDQIRDLQHAIQMNSVNHDEAVKSLQDESRDLRSELSIAKRTIQRLECAIGDQAGYRQLTELNDKLMVELQAYERKVSTLNDKTILLQTEAETMGGYKVKKAQEERELLARRLQNTERRYRLIAPLFAQLRLLVESHLSSYLHPEMLAALEEYDRQSSFVPSSHATKGSPKRKEAASHSRGVAAALESAADNFSATLPATMHPHPPSLSCAPNSTLKRKPSHTSIIVTGTENDYAVPEGRLPPISNV